MRAVRVHGYTPFAGSRIRFRSSINRLCTAQVSVTLYGELSEHGGLIQGGRGSSEGFRVCRVIKAQTRGFRWCPVHRRCTVDRSQGIKLYMTYFSMHNAHTNAQRTASFLYETAADSCSHGPKAAAIGASRARG